MVVDIGEVTVIMDRDEHGPYVITRFADGAQVMARPIDEPWEDTRLHDLLHTLLAASRGNRWSPSLWLAAHPDQATEQLSADAALDEADVLAMQEVLRAMLEV